MTNKDYKTKVTKLTNSEVEIEAVVNSDEFDTARSEAVRKFQQEVTIPGFRKGQAPEKLVIEKIGERPILDEAAETVISRAYPHILAESKISPIGRPEITITKIASGNPLEFKIKTAVAPEVKLPDYRQIAKVENAKKEEPVEVTEKEVEEVISQIRKSRVDHSGHNHENLSEEEHQKMVEKEMPELTDEFVKSLGDFKDVADFKNKIKENIAKEKEVRAKEKKRIAMLEEIIKGTETDLPNILVESELDRMWVQFEGDVSRMGVKIEDYMKHINKSAEDIRKDWRADAEKRAKLQLILNKIATEENIEAPKEEVDKEVKAAMELYEGADPDRARVYFETIMTNEKVIQFLESQK